MADLLVRNIYSSFVRAARWRQSYVIHSRHFLSLSVTEAFPNPSIGRILRKNG